MVSIKNTMRGAMERRDKQLSDMDKLRGTPQRPIPRLEIAGYALVPLLLLMAGVMPSSGMFIMPIVLPLLYLLFRRFGACFPVSCVLGYALFSLLFNYDILTIVLACFLLFALIGLIGCCQTAPYLLCATIAAAIALIGSLVGAGIVRLAYDKPVSVIASEYTVAESEDPIVGLFCRFTYDNAEIPDDVGKLDRADDGYMLAAAEYTAEQVYTELKDYGVYYALHLSVVCVAIGYFVAVAINRRTTSARDYGVTKAEVSGSTRAMGGVVKERKPIAEMKMPRAFLWACVAPSLIASIAFDLIGGMDALSSIIMHAFVTLPGAFGFFTLMTFFASLLRGKARVAAFVVLAILAAACVLFPMVLFFGSMIGIADCLLDLRYWTRYLLDY